MNKKLAKRIQKALKGFNLYTNKVDGIWGRKSREALTKFQNMQGLKPDGIWGKKTSKQLFPSKIPSRRKKALRTQGKRKTSELTGITYPMEKDVKKFYGSVGKNTTRIKLPYPMWLAWDERVKISKMTVHKIIARDVKAMYQEVLDVYGIDEIIRLNLDIFGGSLNVRRIRGGRRWSTHAWAIAIDHDPQHNRLRWKAHKAHFSHSDYDKFFEIVNKYGGTSLGREFGYDYMHIQWASR